MCYCFFVFVVGSCFVFVVFVVLFSDYVCFLAILMVFAVMLVQNMFSNSDCGSCSCVAFLGLLFLEVGMLSVLSFCQRKRSTEE